MNSRVVKKCAPDHECTFDEIMAIADEGSAVHEDPAVRKFVHPSAAEMVTIIAEAEAYTGPWYHSYVVLTPEDYDDELGGLSDRIYALGEDRGVYILSEYTFDEGTEEALNEAFNN